MRQDFKTAVIRWLSVRSFDLTVKKWLNDRGWWFPSTNKHSLACLASVGGCSRPLRILVRAALIHSDSYFFRFFSLRQKNPETSAIELAAPLFLYAVPSRELSSVQRAAHSGTLRQLKRGQRSYIQLRTNTLVTRYSSCMLVVPLRRFGGTRFTGP